MIHKDPRFKVFEKNNERKQAFNAYKIQKQKDEREEARQKTKKAKEDLEGFLLHNEKMTSITKYYRCEEMFGTTELWRNVSPTIFLSITCIGCICIIMKSNILVGSGCRQT